MRIIRDHKVSTALIAVGCVVAVLARYQFVLQQAAALWIVSDALERPADAIVVLGGGLDYRPRAAADLFIQGRGAAIWITHGKMENGPAADEAADLTRSILVKFGVPDAAIVDIPGRASSTYEEAKLVSEWIGVAGGKTLVIPTDPFHTRRAKWILARLVAPGGNSVIVRPISPGTYSPDFWWQIAAGRTGFANEVVKYFYYRVRYVALPG
ncbi:MAG: YdcF family protein [Pseudolabrys sp.]